MLAGEGKLVILSGWISAGVGDDLYQMRGGRNMIPISKASGSLNMIRISNTLTRGAGMSSTEATKKVIYCVKGRMEKEERQK